MESPTLRKSRKKSAVGIALGAAAIVALVAGIVLSSGSASAADNKDKPVIDPLIPTGPITQAEIDACELVLAMDPEPTSYKDDQGRVWTPCVEWWLGINIPDWPSGMWPGQVPYLHKPADTAEWLGCIAGYLVYKGPLTTAASETFTDEAATVDITKKLSARRTILRAYMSKRLAELDRQNLATKCQPNVKPLPLPKPNPPPLPPNPDDLSFDLKGNWGHIPEGLRPWLAKLELASGIPGIARAAGVRWWESFRAKQEPVSTAQAKLIADAHPELARFFVNKSDGAVAKKAIDDDISKQGWPMPVDYDGWIEGSFGLGDILGSTFVYSGIHTEGKKAGPSGLPFVYTKSAKAAYESYEGQCAALAYIVYRVLFGDLKVVFPAIQAPPETQDPKKTWISIFSAYAYPQSYKAKTQLALTAAANYEKRAAEIGIDLNKVAFPWPPGMSYKTWDFGDFWARLLLYAPRTVKHLPGVLDENEQQGQGFVVQTKAQQQFALQGNVQASIASNIPDGASAPLVVFLHDRDADESQLAGLVLADQVNARLVYLRAPNKGDTGYRWFNAELSTQDPSLAAQLEAATSIVSAAGQQLVKLYPGTSSVYVVGFGQGAAIAYRLAARGEVAKVMAISGMLPASLRLGDNGTTKTVMVSGVHGQDDKIVSPADDAATIESFIFKTPAKLSLVPGATHTLESMHDAIGAGLVEMLT